jgi:hypothetical protein
MTPAFTNLRFHTWVGESVTPEFFFVNWLQTASRSSWLPRCFPEGATHFENVAKCGIKTPDQNGISIGISQINFSHNHIAIFCWNMHYEAFWRDANNKNEDIDVLGIDVPGK